MRPARVGHVGCDLAQRCAAARSTGRGKKQCTERTRAPQLPYQEQLLRHGVTMEQLSDGTYSLQRRAVA